MEIKLSANLSFYEIFIFLKCRCLLLMPFGVNLLPFLLLNILRRDLFLGLASSCRLAELLFERLLQFLSVLKLSHDAISQKNRDQLPLVFQLLLYWVAAEEVLGAEDHLHLFFGIRTHASR